MGFIVVVRVAMCFDFVVVWVLMCVFDCIGVSCVFV